MPGTTWADDGNDCTLDQCNGTGSGLHPYKATGSACGDQTDTQCNEADTCNGSGTCLSNLAPMGSPCGDQSDAPCDHPDTCSGTGLCLTNYEDQGVPCPDGRFCNGEEVCDDFGICQQGEPPCPASETCDERVDECRQDQFLIRNYTPIAWQADEFKWIRDRAPLNKIDDLIDHGEQEHFDVVINFKHAVSDEDLAMLNALGPGGLIQGRLKYLYSVMMGGLTKLEIESISGIEGVAFVEQQLGFSSTLNNSVPQICVTPATGGCAIIVPASIQYRCMGKQHRDKSSPI